MEECAKDADEVLLSRLMHSPTKTITHLPTFIARAIQFQQSLES